MVVTKDRIQLIKAEIKHRAPLENGRRERKLIGMKKPFATEEERRGNGNLLEEDLGDLRD